MKHRAINSGKYLEVDKIYYHVHKFKDGRKGWISKIRVVGYARQSEFSGLNDFLPILTYSSDNSCYRHEISLNDANIPENSYNSHRLFHTKEQASKYLYDSGAY